MLIMLVMIWFPRTTQHIHIEPEQGTVSATRLGIALVAAAAIANLAAVGTRTMIVNNYAELNQELHFGPERIGIIASLSLFGQLAGFGLGVLYERWLGMRRLYVAMAVAMVGINLTIAYQTSMALLVIAVLLHGVVLAVAFQGGILAAIRSFTSPRTGTTFHEATVGFAGIAPFLAGQLVQIQKGRGVGTIEALQTPFLVMAGMIVLALALQLFLVGRRPAQRALLEKAQVEFPRKPDADNAMA